jgi:hypothetical protein
VTKDNLKVEELAPTTLPPADPEWVSTTLDTPIREDDKRVVSEEYSRFENFMKRLVRIPKSDIDARRKEA